MTTRPVTMTSPWAASQPHAGQGAGQPHLETSGGLLAAQAADGLDGVARGDDGDVELGEGDDPVHGLRPRQPEGLGHGRVAEHGVDELLRERAHRAREDHGTGEPTEDRRAVDGGREPERAAQPRRRARRSRTAADEGAAEVAAPGDEDGERGEQPADGERDERASTTACPRRARPSRPSRAARAR